MKQRFYISFFLLGLQSAAQAQKISNKGTDFWAAFGHHLQMEVRAWFPTDSLKLVFDFSSEQAAHVVVTIDGTTYRQEYDVPANSVLTSKKIPLPPNREPGSIYDTWLYSRTSNWPGGTNSEGVFKNKGIHIVSDVPIVVFERMYFTASSAATMLFPTDSWGYHYKCLAAPQNWVAGDGNVAGAFSYFFVIANNNNTKIRINPSVPNRSGLPANVPFDVELQKGEVYQFLGAQKNGSTMHEVTGTTITSVANSNGECFPFATFVGSSATAASCPGVPITGSLEHLFQQIFPQQAWGKRYFTIPTYVAGQANSRNTNTFRIMVKDPATVVKRNGIALTDLSNSVYTFTSNTADFIEADLPVQVAQYLPSQVNTCGYTGRGDPDYLILSPVEQGIKRANFLRTSVDHIDSNFLALTIPTSGLSSLKIDGQLNNYTLAYPHPSAPGYSVVVRMWHVRSNIDQRPSAQCTIESDSAFNAYTYGIGPAETYMYNAGTYINNLNGLPFIKNKYNTSDTASLYTCAKTPVELSVLLRYKPTKIFWQLSKLNDTITANADVTMDAPVEVDTIMLNGLPYFRYRLPGTYIFNYPGNHTIPVFASEPTVEQCDQTEQIPYQVEVRDTLQTDFSLLYENCKASELVKLSGMTKFNDSTIIHQWEWSFMNGADTGTASGQNVSYTFNAGNNSANLFAVDMAGCIADTTKTFTLANKPALPDFTVTSTANCVNNTIVFTETTPQLDAQSWFWDFGNGDTSSVFANGHTVNHIYIANDTLTVKHMVKFGNNCYSDTAIQTVIIYANPQLSITYPVGCLPADSVIQFTSQVTTPEKQTVSNYLWNFGDPAATPANPDTSAIANPTHKYGAGDYKVSLKATTSNGCVGDSSWDIKLLPVPQVKYGPVLTPVCFNTAAPVSIATASITNGVAGSGYYNGNGTDSSGNFDPSAAGVGNHTIWYVFKGANGCSDSAAAGIWVHAVPTAAFTAPAETCLDQHATFTDQSTINNTVDVNAKIQTWTWNFGDGNADVIKTNNQPFTKKFTESKAYTVSLKTASADGCVSSIVIDTVQVHALPVADFIMPTNICMPGGQALFTNKSTLTDTSKLSYLWDFGDGSTSTAVNGSHTYSTAKAYTVILKATSGFGCIADTSHILPATAFLSKPAPPAFTVTSTANCVNNSIVFTETTPQLGAQSWFWDFGNGDTSSVVANGHTVNHVYKTNSTLTVRHMVKFNDNCYSDTAIQTVTIYANPVLDITYPVGCLPVDGIIHFTSQVTTPENQAVKTYLWNFGDAAATPGNPNTASIANPSHKYAAGNYKVMLDVATTNGCVSDSSWDISLHPRPVIQYAPVLQPVCFNTAAPVSVASATITNGVAGTGTYKGKGTDSQGNFNPSVANVGNHTIWYVFNSTNGCTDSASSTIWVHAVPDASFTAPANICLDQTATFTDQSTINTSADANAKINTWTWNFGEGNGDVNYTNGNPIVKSFSSSKTYTVNLFTTSGDGCKSNTFSKTITVNPLPVADFSLPSGICMPDGQANFTNKSSISDQSTLTYLWDFGDGSNSTQVNGSHVYAAIGSYTVTLKATSVPGCSTDTAIILPASAFINKPVTGFEVTNDKPCEGSTVNFTDKSSSTNTIASWDWTFGDGTKSTVQNPSKIYTNFGTYKVNLVVKDQHGCTSAAGTGSDIQVRINPKIDAGPNISADENSAVVLNATASNASELVFSWQPAGLLNNPTILQPTYVVKQDQVFVLTATDKDGICISTDEMSVSVLRGVTAPNAFSPNGDGINDVWIIRNLTDYSNASVKIFDRYGKQVYVSQGYAKPWDGTVQGKPVPAGTYYYIIHVKQGERPLNGSVTIIR